MKPWDNFIGDSTKKYGASGVPPVRNIPYENIPKKNLTPSQQKTINALSEKAGLQPGEGAVALDEVLQRAGIQFQQA
jgi:hypothetical protein